ncbi:MAG: hypothetical protein AB7N24_18835 [Dehalococcoidia bacterium]
MTAKEALQARIEGLAEKDAAALLPLADSAFLDWLECLSKSTATAELLQLPSPLRSLLVRYEGRYYSAEDAARDVDEAEDWRFADADATKRIDD